MNEKLRAVLIKGLKPMVKIVGKIQAPYSIKPAITTFYKWIDKIEPLDVLLVNTAGHFSNIFNNGLAKHAVLFIGWEGEQRIPMIIEAIGEGVIKRPLIECIAEKDKLIAITRYNGDRSNMDLAKGITFANAQVGKPYDFELDETSQKKFESFFCSELCFYAWTNAFHNCSFTKRKVFGVDTVQPTDFIDASITGKTILIFDGIEK